MAEYEVEMKTVTGFTVYVEAKNCEEAKKKARLGEYSNRFQGAVERVFVSGVKRL